VDGEGEDSGGNEVHEIYVRLGAAPATALNEKDNTSVPKREQGHTFVQKFPAQQRHTSVPKREQGHTFVQKFPAQQKDTLPEL
jgi:hypothetical protein